MTPCVECSGHRDKFGYGRIMIDGKRGLSHRKAWEQVNGEIPPGLCVLHHCDNPSCINTDHLFLGTLADNTLDMVSKGRHWQQVKTNCPKGHPFDEVNTYITPDGRRQCKECQRERVRSYQSSRKDSVLYPPSPDRK